MKLSGRLPDRLTAACVILHSFNENGLKSENCQYISLKNNINNLSQLINLPWKLQLELVNRKMGKYKCYHSKIL